MRHVAQMIADRLILSPSRHRLSAMGKERRLVPFGRGKLELWTQRVGTRDVDDVDLFVLKFHGTGGRAERSTYHPMDYWTDLRAELWAWNPPGYGGSTGPASVRSLASASEHVLRDLQQVAAGRPILLMGNSLGTAVALHLAANFEIAGMVLRNPPPLRQLVVGRHGWWNLWLGAMLIARCVPPELCSMENAARATCPAIFVRSGQDEIVPTLYQDKVIGNYKGPARIVHLPDARHASPLNLDEQRVYRDHLDWLRQQLSPVESVRHKSVACSTASMLR